MVAGTSWLGAALDNQLGQYYLRSRYLNPSSARFSSSDSFAGIMHEPLSLNKYSYVHNNPINLVDPSGHLAANEQQIGDLIEKELQTQTFPIALNTGAKILLPLVPLAILGAVGPAPFMGRAPNASTITEAEASKNCAQGGLAPDDCIASMPIFFIGREVYDHMVLVRDAIWEQGASPLLNYRDPGHSRSWLDSLDVFCGSGLTGGVTGNDCDEYPYASSVQGGKSNYDGGTVRVRPVNLSQNRSSGAKLLKRLLIPCLMASIPGFGSSPTYPNPSLDGKSLYAVVPAVGLPVTVGRCANGKMNYGSGK